MWILGMLGYAGDMLPCMGQPEVVFCPLGKPKPPKLAAVGLQETSKRVERPLGRFVMAAGSCRESGEAKAKPDKGSDVMKPEDFCCTERLGSPPDEVGSEFWILPGGHGPRGGCLPAARCAALTSGSPPTRR